MSETATAAAQPSSWEGAAQQFADAITDHRAGYWLAADVAREILSAASTGAARRTAIKQLAGLGHCSANYVQHLAALGDAFPQDFRYPDVGMPLYSVCLRTAQRTKEPATRILERALRYNWHCRRVAAIGREHDQVNKVLGQCLACGGRLRFIRRGTPGLMIPCPGCLADAKHERRTLLDAFVIVGPLC
jgi:hypothetical protein